MRLEHISFTTPDKLALPGLLYTPNNTTTRIALYLHGNGDSSVFYQAERHATIGKALTHKGIAYMPFNNRGALFTKQFSWKEKGAEEKTRVRYGMAHELINHCLIDIDAAIAFLRMRGFREFYLIGLSTGANKICVYDYYKSKSPFKKYVLLGGGDDTGIYYNQLGKHTFFQLLKEARIQKRKKQGHELVPDMLLPLSWQSFYDTCNPDGDYNIFPYFEKVSGQRLGRKKLFREFGGITKPTYVLYGEKDEYLMYSPQTHVGILKEYAHPRCKLTAAIMKGADHSFSEHALPLARELARWLSR